MINITKSLSWVLELEMPLKYQVEMDNNSIYGCSLELVKKPSEYSFSCLIPVNKGPQQALIFKQSDSIKLIRPERTLLLNGNHFFISIITHESDESGKMKRNITGSISSFTSSHNFTDVTLKYLRIILPVEKGRINIFGYETSYFVCDDNKNKRFIPVRICSKKYRFYICAYADKEYILIDSEAPTTVDEFRKITYNILLIHGFIKGDFFSDEGYIISFDTPNMLTPESISYHSMSSTILTGHGIHTSNPFSVYHDVDFEREENYEIKKEVKNKLYEGVSAFSASVFSELAESCYLYEKFQRAILLYINGHISNLEIRLPNYYVALEAIAAQVATLKSTGKKENLKPIKDKKIAKELIAEIILISLDKKQSLKLDDSEFDIEIFKKNILKLNFPPNADKLAKAFSLVNYDLSLIPDGKQILRDRNLYLHGSFISFIENDDKFRNALHLGLRLHFMIAVLLLKHCNYSGKIINYSEFWKSVTKKDITEERLVMI
jgi:hypothetical protein